MENKFDFKFLYDEKKEDSVEFFINSLEEDNGDGDDMPGISMIYLTYIIKINGSESQISTHFFFYFPKFFEYIKQKENVGLLCGGVDWELFFNFIGNNKVHLKLYFEKKLITEDTILIKDLIETMYKELYSFIDYFRTNANLDILPNSVKYLDKLEKYLDKNPIENYLE